MAKVALGRGLGALIGGSKPSAPSHPAVASPEPVAGERVEKISLKDIYPSPFQPRREFRSEQLTELTESIREHGIIQPLVLRKANGRLELIAGERRWRAAQEVGLPAAPAIIREATDQEVLELALIENLQRADLNPVEEAQAYQRLATEFSLRQEDIAKKVGKSRAAVANAIRLLDLDEQVQSWLVQGRITVGHAKVLLALKTPEEQRLIAERVLRESATVRATERLVQAQLKGVGSSTTPAGSANGKPAASGLSPALLHIQNRLQQHLATHVQVHPGANKGSIEIEYYGHDDLNRILDLLRLPQE